MKSKKIGLLPHAKDVVLFAAGQTVYRQGDPGDLVCVVQPGEREVLHDGQRLDTLGEGNLFGSCP